MRKVFVSATVPALALVLALSACGERTQVRLKDGQKPPPMSYGQGRTPSATTLLLQPAISAPERNVELHIRSEDRLDDPFDLPPPD